MNVRAYRQGDDWVCSGCATVLRTRHGKFPQYGEYVVDEHAPADCLPILLERITALERGGSQP